jgi:hypothetical protein
LGPMRKIAWKIVGKFDGKFEKLLKETAIEI